MGRVISVLGDDISTDVIYPGRYMATVLPSETPQFAFADDLELNRRLKNHEFAPGSVLVGGKNFGCGSSREQATSTLKGHALTIVAESFARIFLQNSVNLGLDIVTVPGVEAALGDELALEGPALVNRTSGRRFAVVPLPQARQAIIAAGGLIAYTRARLMARRTTGSAPGSV